MRKSRKSMIVKGAVERESVLENGTGMGEVSLTAVWFRRKITYN